MGTMTDFTEIEEIFIGDMGIKQVYSGADELLFERKGGFLYVQLDTGEQE